MGRVAVCGGEDGTHRVRAVGVNVPHAPAQADARGVPFRERRPGDLDLERVPAWRGSLDDPRAGHVAAAPRSGREAHDPRALPRLTREEPDVVRGESGAVAHGEGDREDGVVLGVSEPRRADEPRVADLAADVDVRVVVLQPHGERGLARVARDHLLRRRARGPLAERPVQLHRGVLVEPVEPQPVRGASDLRVRAVAPAAERVDAPLRDRRVADRDLGGVGRALRAGGGLGPGRGRRRAAAGGEGDEGDEAQSGRQRGTANHARSL